MDASLARQLGVQVVNAIIFFSKTKGNVMHDLLRWGFEPSYMQWEFHGESSDKDVSSSDSDNNDFNVNLVKER